MSLASNDLHENRTLSPTDLPGDAGKGNWSELLAPNHASRYLCRYFFLALLMLYILSFQPGVLDPWVLHWILSVGSIYALLLALAWGMGRRRPASDFWYLIVLLLDMAALGLALPYDPTPACPAMIAMLLMVFDNGFRRESQYYLFGYIAATLVGVTVCVFRDYMYGSAMSIPTAWTLAFVLFSCGYGFFLFKALMALRRRLDAVYQLADASDDYIFALNGSDMRMHDLNQSARQRVGPGASLLEMFDIKPGQAEQFVKEALGKGQTVREWALRGDGDQMVELKARVFPGNQRLACTGRDVSFHHERAERLLEQSRSDALTGLPNRRSLDRKLFTEWRRMLRAKKPLAVLMIDIDWFKNYNDALGHQAGDLCLQRIASLLRNNMLRAGDYVARYGGEEFTMIAPNCDQKGLETIAQRLINLVSAERIENPASPLGYVTISIGAAAVIPLPDLESRTLLASADQALYQAKEFGRNRLVLAKTLAG